MTANARSLTGAARRSGARLFTVVSFLTTTGFVSTDWDVARTWSGLEAPGLILMGLAVFGGGVGDDGGRA